MFNNPSIVGVPRSQALSFSHMLQTEVTGYMNAVKQSLHVEPALAEGLAARRSITSTSQVASHARDLCPERSYRHDGGRETHVSSQDRERFWLDELMGRTFWRQARKITHVQQPHGKRRQQAQQAQQALGALHLSFLDPTSRFAALMSVLHPKAGRDTTRLVARLAHRSNRPARSTGSIRAALRLRGHLLPTPQ
jgi:hypothetical protein